MRSNVVGRRGVLGAVGGLLGYVSGVGAVSAQNRAVQTLRLTPVGLRNVRQFSDEDPLRILVGGVSGDRFAYAHVTLTASGQGKTGASYGYTATDDLWTWRRGRHGHELLVPAGVFRPEIGDEVVLSVSLFDEADALFGKGVTSWKVEEAEGKY